MYPYPSGDLHIGHWYIVTPTDALARFRRMHGYNVFFPIGFDAFGLPAENAAIKSGGHPFTWTMQNIENMRRQFRTMGATFDWEHEVVTADPAYYRWNQWLFLRFLEAGLAYRAMSPVDWCPNDGTLAREQVEGADRHCWRCGALVEKRDLEQWFLRTTAYADELLDFTGLDWPEPIRIHADQLDRPVRGRRDRLRGRARRAPAGRRPPARLHDPARHAVRGDVHGPRPGAPARRDADRTPTAGPRSRPTSSRPAGGPRSSACRPTARRPAWPSAPTPSTRSTASASRSSSPTTSWPATAPARSWPSPPTTSATSSSPRRFGLPIRRVVAAPGVDADAPMDDAYIAHAAGERAGQQRPVRRAARRRGRQGDRRLAGARPAAPSPRSPTACATGWSAASATGARPSRSSTARDDGIVPVPYEDLPVRLPETVDYAGSGDNPLNHDEAFLHVDCPTLRRPGPARDRHDGHVHGLVVVLVPLPVARRAGRPGRSRDDRSLDAGRPVHRRRRARGHAPAVQPLLHQGDGRRRPGPRPRAVPAPVQPGPDPGRRRRADEQVARQRPGPRRARRTATARTRSACS